jgi:copper(I)-binding protein
MTFSRLAIAALVLAVHGSAWAGDYKKGDIEIEDLWVRATAPGQPNGGGYMEIENHGKAADELLAVKSDVAQTVEIHETRDANGMSTMRKVDAPLTIPPGGEVKFAPGGYHVMFVKLKQAFKEGTEIPATLTFRQAGEVPVVFKVKPLTYKPQGMSGHMAH